MAFVFQKYRAVDPETGAVVRKGGFTDSTEYDSYLYECKDYECEFAVFYDYAFRPYKRKDGKEETVWMSVSAYVLEPDLRFSFCMGFGDSAGITPEEIQACETLEDTYLTWRNKASKQPELAFDDPGLPPRLEAAYAEFRAAVEEGLWICLTEGGKLLVESPDYRLNVVRRECELPPPERRSYLTPRSPRGRGG